MNNSSRNYINSHLNISNQIDINSLLNTEIFNVPRGLPGQDV